MNDPDSPGMLGRPDAISSRIRKDGLAAAIMLSFLATAGLFYVNLGGAFLSAFVDGLGLSRETAGYVTSANKYGAAFGALMATLGARYLPWRRVAYCVLITLISIDVISFNVTSAPALIGIRFLHGTVGGFLVGIGLAVIARTPAPDRVFGMLLAVQYTFGSIGIWSVPRLVDHLGHGAAFGALILFSAVTFLMVPFIPDYHGRRPGNAHGTAMASAVILPLALTLAAIFTFQASNMGIADYAIELGKDRGHEIRSISSMLTGANAISICGALAVYVVGIRFGRLLPLILGISVAVAGTLLFHRSFSGGVFFAANALTGITWAFTIPFLLGLCATFDARGQMAALAGFVSKMGLASGPLIAASVVGDGNFPLIINLAAGGLALCGLLSLIPAHRLDRPAGAPKPIQGEA